MDFDDNIRLAGDGLHTECRHCGETLGLAHTAPLARARLAEQPSTAAGAGIRADPRHYTDRAIVLRQRLCPQCLVLLATEIVPQDEAAGRGWRVG
ncbi:hypothetical protein [Pseudorhodoferax sp.]|uniref:hypothetical protein n=1 Tax=Pseudorhodoferax sp. TaxID=1993553 RepID=UPI002DD65CEA|nr:hypothetical protein [Pseudorhodoferax sp.]